MKNITDEEKSLNKKVCKKMRKELENFKKELCLMPPQEILTHCHEKAFKEDFLTLLEDEDAFLNVDLAKALLALEKPLEEIYNDWVCHIVVSNDEDTYIGDLKNIIIQTATEASLPF